MGSHGWSSRRTWLLAAAAGVVLVLCVVWLVSRSKSPATEFADPATPHATGGLGQQATTRSDSRADSRGESPGKAHPGRTGQGGQVEISSMLGMAGSGSGKTQRRHRVVVTAGAQDGLVWVNWKMPRAVGRTSGAERDPGTSWSYSGLAVGDPKYIGVFTYSGPGSGTVWCRVTVDGRVTDYQRARGPWGGVRCLG